MVSEWMDGWNRTAHSRTSRIEQTEPNPNTHCCLPWRKEFSMNDTLTATPDVWDLSITIFALLVQDIRYVYLLDCLKIWVINEIDIKFDVTKTQPHDMTQSGWLRRLVSLSNAILHGRQLLDQLRRIGIYWGVAARRRVRYCAFVIL